MSDEKYPVPSPTQEEVDRVVTGKHSQLPEPEPEKADAQTEEKDAAADKPRGRYKTRAVEADRE